MANVKLKDFSKSLRKKLSKIEKVVTQPAVMNKLGEQLKDDVQTRVRLGYGVSRDGASKEKFKPLSESYRLQRSKKLGFWTNPDGLVIPIKGNRNKSYLEQNLEDLDSTTSPKKSNLTRTGEMLRSLSVSARTGKFSIRLTGSDNKKKGEYVSKERPFMNASKQEIKRVTKSLEKLITKILKVNN